MEQRVSGEFNFGGSSPTRVNNICNSVSNDRVSGYLPLHSRDSSVDSTLDQKLVRKVRDSLAITNRSRYRASTRHESLPIEIDRDESIVTVATLGSEHEPITQTLRSERHFDSQVENHVEVNQTARISPSWSVRKRSQRISGPISIHKTPSDC